MIVMHRKAFLGIVLLFIAGTLTGCDPFGFLSKITTTIDDGGTTTAGNVSGVTVSGDADAVDIEILTFASGVFFFDCSIDEIEFDVLLNRVVITLSIDDGNYRDFTYIAVMEPVSGGGTKTHSLFRRTATQSSHRFVYDIFSSSADYRFLIGKFYKYQTYPDSITADAAAGFTMRIPDFDLRSHVGLASIDFPDYNDEQWDDIYTDLGRIRTGITIAFEDPDVAVTSVTLAFYEVSSDKLAAEATFDVPATRDAGGHAWLRNISMSGLSPGVDYAFFVLASGNDGMRDFTDKTIGNRSYTTDGYWGTVDSTHGMYAYIRDGQMSASGYGFSVHYSYDGHTFIAGTDVPIEFVVRVRDRDDGTVLYEAPLAESGTSTHTIPTDMLYLDGVISVESVGGESVLCKSGIPFVEPTVFVQLGGTPDARTLTVWWTSNDGVFTGGYIEIVHNGVVLATFPYEQWSAESGIVLPVPGIPENYVDFWANFHVEYDAFQGNDTGLIAYGTGPI